MKATLTATDLISRLDSGDLGHIVSPVRDRTGALTFAVTPIRDEDEIDVYRVKEAEITAVERALIRNNVGFQLPVGER